MIILEKLQHKLIQLLCRMMGFVLNVKEEKGTINLNVNILTEKGKENFRKVISKVCDKLKKEE